MKLIDEVIEKMGGPDKARATLGLASREAIYNWRVRGAIPKKHLIEIHYVTGISLERLQPKGHANPKS